MPSLRPSAALLFLVLVAGCNDPEAEREAERRAAIEASLAHEDRPDEDRENDAARKPLRTLLFAGLEPGMAVLELEAGGGYFTEIMARTVGPTGSVILQNPAVFDGILGDAVPTRTADDRLPNVTVSKTDFDDLSPDDGSIDVVTWIQGPHELWFRPQAISLGEPEATFDEIARVLKPGGTFLVIDHRAPDGAEPETGGTLHRITLREVRTLAEGAGLTLVEEADFLANDDDPRDISVFDPAIRGQTDQFVALFTK